MEPEIIWEDGQQAESPIGTAIATWEDGRLVRLRHYVLQNKGAGTVGNSAIFWAETGGYRSNLQEAKRFTLEDARQIVESARGSHEFVIWDYDDLMGIVEFHVDAGRLWEMREKAK